MSDSESVHSDVSLDEEDEELIWRVFYSPLEEQNGADENLAEFQAEEISDLSDIEDEELVNKYKRLKRQEQGEEDLDDDEKKRLLITSFSNDQMERFEAYRRMAVNKPGVKKICNGVLGHSIPQNIAVVMAGLSKSLLGDIITKAFEVQENEFKTKLIMDIDAKKKRKRDTLQRLSRGEDVSSIPEKNLLYMGDSKMPLTPEHIREAWRLYRLENSGTFPAKWRTQGEGDGLLFR
ncbi:hypothetical protein OXX80_012238 [Metschnikowia pulcherrima]